MGKCFSQGQVISIAKKKDEVVPHPKPIVANHQEQKVVVQPSQPPNDTMNIINPPEETKAVRAEFRTNKLSGRLIEESQESKVLKIIKETNDSLEDFDLINKALEHQFFTRNVQKSSFVQIAKIMSLCEVKNDTVLFKQGSIGNFFYIVKQGKLELSINEKFIKNIVSGEYFGELALLHEAPRSGTVKTVSDTVFYVLERKNFRKIINEINEMNFEENKKFVDSVQLLTNIDNDQKIILIQNLVQETWEQGKVIIREGEVGSCMYIIKEGEVECVSKETHIRNLYKGECFGERCLWLDNVRTMNVIAKTTCTLYSVSTETLKQMVGEKYKDFLLLNFIKTSFEKSENFKTFTFDIVKNIYEKMKLYYYEKGKTVFGKDFSTSAKIIILVDGRIINSRTKELFYERGNILFEKQIITNSNEKLVEEYIAEPDCLLAMCDISVLFENSKENIQHMVDQSGILDSLKKIPLFKNLSNNKLKSVVNNIKIDKFPESSTIIKQGETSNKFYIVKSGKVDIYINDHYTRTLNPTEYFGERSLFFDEPRSATAKAKGTVETYTLNQEDFKAIIEDGLKKYLLSRLNLQDNIELEELNHVKQLGSGGYGNVYLVISKKNNCYYALKSISRAKVDAEELHSYLEREKGILLQIDHQFIVKLVKTLGDEKNIYFLMEFVKGKELWDVIREIGLLNKYQTQFYTCSILLAVQYLQKRNFVHRDIKPENVVVTESGFIKLIDFGTAKKIIDRTSTIIGSPHYMAPEVILGVGYSFSIDVWSTAVCMYEFFCGGVPFGNDAKDPMDVYSEIVKSDLVFPKFVKDKDFLSLMKKMLDKNPVTRLLKISIIKQNRYFDDFDWEKLANLDAKIPYTMKAVNLVENEKTNVQPFINFIKTEPEFVPTKKKNKLDNKKKEEYQKWHKNF